MFFAQKSLALSIILGLLIIAPESPPWIIGLSFFVLGLKAYFEWRGIKPWSPKLSIVIALCLVAEVFVRLGSLFNQDATITLILGLTALRIMDYKSSKDNNFLVLLGFVIFSLKPLFTLDFFWLPPCFLGFFGLWRTMYEGDAQSANRYIYKIFAFSLPMTVVLFFIFPRIVLPWAKEQKSSKGQIGFSENLNPGSLSELVAIDEVAFRVKFNNKENIKVHELYWRGGVLEEANGLAWHPGSDDKDDSRKNRTQHSSTSKVSYEIVLEDFKSKTLFALDRPLELTAPLRTIKKSGEYFRWVQAPSHRIIYSGVSDLSYEFSDPSTPDQLKITELGPKSTAWLQEVNSKYINTSDRLDQLNRLFQENGFKYTLAPGTYDNLELDDFLFSRKLGFCEHFAASYASLARGLGIPSRVIVGFHGGSFNSYGQFWEVSSKDAHAWVEIFINSKWLRVDPTRWIEPRRLEIGGTAFFQLDSFFSNSSASEAIRETYRLAHQFGVLSFYRRTIDYFDHLNFLWVQFMFNFNLRNQYSFFFTQGIFLVIALIAISAFVILTLSKLDSKKSPLALCQKYILNLLKLYTKRLPLNPGETPNQYFIRWLANTECDDQTKSALVALLDKYNLQMYAGDKVYLKHELQQLYFLAKNV